MSKLDRYLTSYVRRRRIMALLRAVSVAISAGLLWKMIFTHLIAGEVVLMLAIVAQPVWFLFKRPNIVAVAIEIEAAQSAFDQKLITIVSQQERSELTDYLRNELELMIGQTKGRSLVKFGSLLAPLGIMIGILVLFVLTDHH